MEKATLNVNGMTCTHCENAVRKAVGKMDGVDKVIVNLTDKSVIVEYNSSIQSLDKIKAEIENHGYDVLV